MILSLQQSHRPITVVKVVTPKGESFTIPVIKGSITSDRTARDYRRTIEFTTTAQYVYRNDGSEVSLVPISDFSPLNIYGHHVWAYRGVLWNDKAIPSQLWQSPAPIPPWLLRFDNLTGNNKPSGTPQWASDLASNPPYELVPIGVFRINSVQVEEGSEAQVQITVSGSDISNNIAKNHWTSPVTVWKSKYAVPVSKVDTTPEVRYTATNVKDAIQMLIEDRWPPKGHRTIFGNPKFNFSGVVDAKLTAPVVMGARTVSSSGSNSPWTDISALASSMGAELFVDVNGSFTLRTVPDPNTLKPSWAFLDGSTNGGIYTPVLPDPVTGVVPVSPLIQATRKLDDSKAVNYVIATGENTGTKTPLKAIAMDNDPKSPTYYLGEFGRVVAYEPGRKKLTTQKMVQKAADTYLNWFVGGDESVTFEGVVNPALDAGDVVKVRRRSIGIFDNALVLAELSADTSKTAFTTLTVHALQARSHLADGTPNPISIAKGEIIRLRADYKFLDLYVTADAPIGAKTIHVCGIQNGQPTNTGVVADYFKGTVLVDPNEKGDGSIAYYIDKIVIPLEPETALQLTARERRIGTRQDAIRIGEYSQGY